MSNYRSIPNTVIPAKAGIHGLTVPQTRGFRPWIPDQVGNDKVVVARERAQ